MRYKDTSISQELIYDMGGSPGDVSEDPVTQEKQKKGWRISCDVGEAMEGLSQFDIDTNL